ncbi:uncharacterized protein GGS22DRAFT_153982 [Annulohypoxylon maeteangense]|uniref:uncharacterized protein n=1 Tax=Annulohypoxylon maeteangense TaxID=1927788 RepID=UPI002008A68D|nr:uncharacterized protein GGS22DRAFT_153982 [Annulohypoxylon maeteangense]KAI0889476.1 hypothetical protein GGS22DRAFT_153982 [Annulohypoxylon maeteangense]
MATAETVDLGPAHPPKEESIKAFGEVEHELKKQLLHMKHTYLKHEPEYFAAVQDLSDGDLTSFTSSDFEEVRVGISAYGLHLFGKVRIPAASDAYIHIRLFIGGDGHDEPGVATLHSIHTEDAEDPEGGRKYRAIFTKDDPLEWFDT